MPACAEEVVERVTALLKEELPGVEAAVRDWCTWIEHAPEAEQHALSEELCAFMRENNMLPTAPQDGRQPEWSLGFKQRRALLYYALAQGLARQVRAILREDESTG